MDGFDRMLDDSSLGAPHVKAVIEAGRANPAWCPCGHDLVSGRYMCVREVIYGPCPDERCGGVCEGSAGDCSSPDCRCKEDQ